MSVAFTSIKGLTFYDMRRAFNGFTLITPVEGTGAWLIDMYGRIVHLWDTGLKPAWQSELLPNGHLLYQARMEDGPLADFEGAGGVLIEVDWEGNKVWEHKDLYIHHGFWRMNNGNTLVIRWVEIPEEIAKQVKVDGTDPVVLGWGSRRSGPMWGDAIQEITPEGEVAWEWIAHEHLDPRVDLTCAICPPNEWTHATSVGEMPDGNIMVSFMEGDTIIIIDKRIGSIKWRFGRRIFQHQHFATVLDEGNILVFDNDFHSLVPRQNSRILEVCPKIRNPTIEKMYLTDGALSNATVWSYQSTSMGLFFSSTLASCQRLPNANNLICEGNWGRIFEINAKGELVWEFVNTLPSYEASSLGSKPCRVYSAFRYGFDYSGLKRDIPLPKEKQAAPDTIITEEIATQIVAEEAMDKEALGRMQARLRELGYQAKIAVSDQTVAALEREVTDE